MTPKLLKQTTTGEIYVWTEALSKRDDMEPYERVVVPTIVVPPEPVPKEQVDEDIKEVAQAVLVKKTEKKPNGNKVKSK